MPQPIGAVLADNGFPVLIVDTQNGPIQLQLQEISTNPYRSLTIKDAYGTFGSNYLYIQTFGSDLFEGNYLNSLVLSNNYTCVTLYASLQDTTWYIFNQTETLNNLFATDLIPVSAGLNIGSPLEYPVENIYVNNSISFGNDDISIVYDGPNLNINGNLIINGDITGKVFTGDGSGLSNLNLGSYGISSLSSIVSYGLSSIVTYGTSSLSSIVSYGLSTVARQPNPGLSSLSSIVSYGLSTVARQPNPGLSSLSSIVSYGFSSLQTYGTSSLSSIVSYGLSSLRSDSGISSLSSIVSYGLSSLRTDLGISSLSSILSYGLSSLANGVVTINGQLIINSNSSNPALTVNGVLDLIDTYYGSNNNINVTSNILYFNNNVLYGQLQYIPQFITF